MILRSVVANISNRSDLAPISPEDGAPDVIAANDVRADFDVSARAVNGVLTSCPRHLPAPPRSREAEAESSGRGRAYGSPTGCLMILGRPRFLCCVLVAELDDLVSRADVNLPARPGINVICYS
jgi:hypothetical protein